MTTTQTTVEMTHLDSTGSSIIAASSTASSSPTTSRPGSGTVQDEETPHIFERDPLNLQTSVKSPADIKALKTTLSKKNNTKVATVETTASARRRHAGRTIASSSAGAAETNPAYANDPHIDSIDPASIPKKYRKKKADVRGVEKFYEAQNELITTLLKSVEEHRQEAKDEVGGTRIKYLIAVHGSLAANIILSALQVYAAVSSGSLSLFATMADSIFDPLSNILLIVSHRAVDKVDPNKYPSGKARLENAGNIMFCFLMCCVSAILIVLSIQDIATHDDNEAVKDFHLPAVIAVCAAFATKFFLFLWCWGLKETYSQVRILWEDHRNDLMINGLGILTSVGGSHLKWWLDPAGAIVLSVLIFGLWTKAAWGEFQLLIGVTADNSTLQQITYLAMTHSQTIHAVDTVRCYHSGPRLIVEVDVVMPEDISLKESHDVAEELQIKLESLPGVERAYVHVDYETEHKPEHFLKKVL